MREEGDYLDQQSVWAKPGGIAAGVSDFAVAKIVGLTALVPLGIGFAAFVLLNKYSRMRPQLVPAVAASLAQIGWLMVAILLAPSILAVVWLDIAIVFALIMWLTLNPNRIAAAILIAFQCMALAYNAFQITTAPFLSGPFAALLLHIPLRIAIIGFTAAFVLKFKSATEDDVAEIFA